MSRTNLEIDDAVMARVQAEYGLRTTRDAVDDALRRLLVEPMSLREVRSLRGSGWPGDLDEMRARGRPAAPARALRPVAAHALRADAELLARNRDFAVLAAISPLRLHPTTVPQR